jgi:SPP1 family phage portal protein
MTTGYFNITDLLKLKIFADRNRIDSARIGDLIKSDISSEFKRKMAQSVNYYNGKHDILNNKTYYWIRGERQENKARSNYKIPHPFHKVLIDEKVAYLTGNPLTIGIAGEDRGDAKASDYRKALLNIFTEKFDDVVSDWVRGASEKGVEWVHFYIDKSGELKYTIVPAEQIIAVYDAQYEDKLLFVIRFYEYDLIKENGEVLRKYKVEQWTDTNVEYFQELEDGSFVHDLMYEYNPSPHWFEYSTNNSEELVGHSWGRVPFIPLLNNYDMKNDLEPIKKLIDAYDLAASGWLNDLEDFANYVWVVKNFQDRNIENNLEVEAGITSLATVVKNIKEDGAVSVGDDGDVKVIRNEIPIEAKKQFLDLCSREIIYFGEGSDVSSDLLGKSHAPSGVALQFLYARLDMKCNRMLRKLQSALKDFVWFVTKYINAKENKDFNSDDVTFTVNKAQIFNEAERVQMLISSNSLLSLETQLENHPLVDDVQNELDRIKRELQDPILKDFKYGKIQEKTKTQIDNQGIDNAT